MKPTPKVYLVIQYFYDEDEIGIMGIFDNIKDLFIRLVALEQEGKLHTSDYVCGVAKFSKNKLYSFKPQKINKDKYVWLTRDSNWDKVFSDKDLGL